MLDGFDGAAAGLVDAGPSALQFLVRAGLPNPAPAFAQGVKAAGQRDQSTGLVGYLRRHLASSGFAVLVEEAPTFAAHQAIVQGRAELATAPTTHFGCGSIALTAFLSLMLISTGFATWGNSLEGLAG